MSKLRPSLTTPSAPAFARAAVNRIGYETRTFGCLVHEITVRERVWLPGARDHGVRACVVVLSPRLPCAPMATAFYDQCVQVVL